ncbi:MAG: DUF1343 domain-containing protein, partial [Ignavibacteria bacterium]
MKNIFLFILLISLSFCSSKLEEKDLHKKVLTGADILLSEKLELIKNKRVGLTVNHSSLLSNGEHLIDAL